LTLGFHKIRPKLERELAIQASIASGINQIAQTTTKDALNHLLGSSIDRTGQYGVTASPTLLLQKATSNCWTKNG
jgi:hypothetical protein